MKIEKHSFIKDLIETLGISVSMTLKIGNHLASDGTEVERDFTNSVGGLFLAPNVGSRKTF